eukprot:SAG11_NODE_21254_length_428_cov_5.003040_1_plen_42_part_10
MRTPNSAERSAKQYVHRHLSTTTIPAFPFLNLENIIFTVIGI